MEPELSMTMPIATGNIFVVKRSYLLRLAIFQNVEVALGEVGDQAIAIVDHGGMQRDFVHFLLEDVDVVMLPGRLLPLRSPAAARCRPAWLGALGAAGCWLRSPC